jgi:hypothetical protein
VGSDPSGRSDPPTREFFGFIVIGELGQQQRTPLSLRATSYEDAEAQVIAEYGDGHYIYLVDVEAANRIR